MPQSTVNAVVGLELAVVQLIYIIIIAGLSVTLDSPDVGYSVLEEAGTIRVCAVLSGQTGDNIRVTITTEDSSATSM